MKNFESKVASLLLQIKAIIIDPANPFTWASGWISPIYCDNRKILSFPEIRSYICDLFVNEIKTRYPNTEIIAGVATGAIAMATLIADRLNLPLIYVRPKAKSHGLGKQIEGHFGHDKKVTVIEDLISTGNSSLSAVEILRSSKLEVLGMLANFTYGFDIAESNFKKAGCALNTLCNYNILLKEAIEKNYIKKADEKSLIEWRKNPENWRKN